MLKELSFSRIKYASVFEPDFENLGVDGIIRFKKQPHAPGSIAVLYAPNGTGKSTLSKVLGAKASEAGIGFEASYNGRPIGPEDEAFFVIRDQIHRNIIQGTASDYLLAPNIQRERKLKEQIDAAFSTAFVTLHQRFRAEYKVTKAASYLLKNGVCDAVAKRFITNLVQANHKGDQIKHEDYIEYISELSHRRDNPTLAPDKRQFIIEVGASNESLLQSILDVPVEYIVPNPEAEKIGRDDDAIHVLEKYPDDHVCIVCDSPDIDYVHLLQKKQEHRSNAYQSLDEKARKLLEGILSFDYLDRSDPFYIKQIVMVFITTGIASDFINLQKEIAFYTRSIANQMINELITVFDGTPVYAVFSEYQNMISEHPVIDEEDLMYICDVISSSIGKTITLKRDSQNDNAYKLELAGMDFIGKSRDDLQLSSGEQNFISLAFELLLARGSSKEFVIIDDPISSFDSIYKNRIAFCLIKFLDKKHQIILTHNTDLIRLLDVQQKDCFELHLFCNTKGGRNGFVPVTTEEKNILIYLNKLVSLLSNKDNKLAGIIKNQRAFLMAMIPFMRGYAHIQVNGNDLYERLSRVMHGYETGSIDVAKEYTTLFTYKFATSEIVSVSDILELDCSSIGEIVDSEQYPLFNDTLTQTLVYYHLRMKVEHELCRMFVLRVDPNRAMQLYQIIRLAFTARSSLDEHTKRKYQVFFNSRKTLLNEFNHFECNLNLFQPAIDITPTALAREVQEIDKALIEIQAEIDSLPMI